jgi:hypothetical protein
MNDAEPIERFHAICSKCGILGKYNTRGQAEAWEKSGWGRHECSGQISVKDTQLKKNLPNHP